MKSLWQLVRSLDRELRRSVANRWAWLRLVSASQGRIAWDCVVRVTRESRAVLGAGSYCSHGTVIAAKASEGRPSSISIGCDTSIGEYNNLRAEGADIVIGDRCLLAQFVSVIASGHEYKSRDLPISEQGVSEKRGVIIEDDVWIGVMVTVLPGVTLGRGCVVGSGAVVTRDVPPYAIVVGNPARVVGQRS